MQVQPALSTKLLSSLQACKETPQSQLARKADGTGDRLQVQPHLAQHIVGQQEGVLQRRVVAHHVQQPAGSTEVAE